MIKKNRWSPDTCDCVLFYSWDDTVPDEEIVNVFDSIENVCSEHQGFTDQEVYDAVLSENQAKNKGIGQIADNFPELTQEVAASDGSLVKEFAPGNQPTFTFTKGKGAQRSLSFSVPGKSEAEVQAATLSVVDEKGTIL